MIYSEKEARELVIKAGHVLVEKQLIARTWGNISAKCSETEFVITPSGKPYETLRPEDLVKVRIEDLSYEGNVKPSSEKGIHAECYKLRPDAGFVIHTHQKYASAVSVLNKDMDFAPCASYGLPGTKKLKKAAVNAISRNPEKKSFLLTRHGALCIGTDYTDAFNEAENLEKLSEAYYREHAKDAPDKIKAKPYLDDYAQIAGFGRGAAKDEDPLAIELIKEKNGMAACIACGAKVKPMGCIDVILQHAVYSMKYSKLKDKK